MKQNKFPADWDKERTQRVLTYYETQTEEEAVAEDEAIFRKRVRTLRGHFDGQQIRLDEPFELKPDTKLIITVLPEEVADDEYNIKIVG